NAEAHPQGICILVCQCHCTKWQQPITSIIYFFHSFGQGNSSNHYHYGGLANQGVWTGEADDT
ncbi:MAG: hypothetical protein RSD07_12940, partial [Angelakisella sp.]